MKTQLLKMVVALFAMIIGLNTAFGQQPPLPMVTGSTSTAKPANGTSSATRRVALMSTSPAVNITMVPIVAPPQGTPTSGPVLERLINDWNIENLVSNHGYQLCRGKISTLNINARQTSVLQQLIEIKSVSELDEVSISEVSAKSTSTPTALDRIYTVGGNGYGPAAVGYKADGTIVTSGPPTEKVAKIIFVTQMAVFDDTQEKIDSWVQSWPNFTINYEVRHGSATHVGRGTVSLTGYGNYRPELVPATTSGFVVSGGDPSRPYIIQSAPEADGPYVDNTGSLPVYSGDAWALPPEPRQEQRRFFRLRDAGW